MFGSPSGYSPSGWNPTLGGFGSTSGQTSPFGSTIQQIQRAFQNNACGLTAPFGASSQPTSGPSSMPAYSSIGNSASGARTSPSFGDTTTPALGAIASPAFGGTATPTSSATAAPAFGATTTPAFGTTTFPAFGSATSLLFGSTGTSFGTSSLPAFGSATTPAFGSQSTSVFGSSGTPAFGAQSVSSLGSSTPAFGTPFGIASSMFGAQSSPFDAQTVAFAFGNPCFGQSSLRNQLGGSRLAAYSQTSETEGASGTQANSKLDSISAMPVYKDKSHEELRWDDYQLGDRGSSLFGQNPTFGVFGSTPRRTSPFGSTIQQAQPAFGSNAFGSTTPFGASSQPTFGASTATFGSTGNSAFGATTAPIFGAASRPAFGAIASPAFGATTTPAFGATTSPEATTMPAFGATISPAFVSATTSLFGSTGTTFGIPSSPLVGSTATPAFGSQSTSGFGSSSTAFGGQSACSLGSSSTSAFGTPFDTIPATFGVQSSPFSALTAASTFGNPDFEQSSLRNQRGGSRLAAYSQTSETQAASGTQANVKLDSISAMLMYKDKSHEELRWEDHQLGDKGGASFAGRLIKKKKSYAGQPAGGANSAFGSSLSFNNPQPCGPFQSSTTCTGQIPFPFGQHWVPVASGGPMKTEQQSVQKKSDGQLKLTLDGSGKISVEGNVDDICSLVRKLNL